MMQILVTGGAGFIGSHLCDRLLAAGHRVTAADNFLTGRPANLAHLAGEPNFRLIEQDVSRLQPDESYAAIFHLASPASPVGYGKRPIETLLVNSQGTYHLLELARRHGARFLLASTSEVYGDPTEHPQREDYWGNVNPVGPRSCYDEGKRFAEALTINYVWEYGLDARVVRIFNTYGPRSDPEDGRIVPNFVSQAVTGRPITVFGDGQQTRSYCYVSDLVRGLEMVMFAPDLAGEVFNLGNPAEVPALEFAHLIRKLAGSDSPIVHEPARPEEIARRRPEITKATARLGWAPQVPLEDGLRATIAWFREQLGVPTS
jgi:nucleoside-diphosphate-sugar epimerase